MWKTEGFRSKASDLCHGQLHVSNDLQSRNSYLMLWSGHCPKLFLS
jgi:hypothetical protein